MKSLVTHGFRDYVTSPEGVLSASIYTEQCIIVLCHELYEGT